MSYTTEQIISKVIELSGGAAALSKQTDEKLAFINEKWDQDVVGIGRVLRAHIFVEYFMTKCLQAINPNLGSLDGARVNFSTKLKLLKGYSNHIDMMLPGIRRLNTIRNRMAHSLEANIDDKDIEVILSDKYFESLREEHAKPEKPSTDKFEIIEDFAQHVGAYLESEGHADSLAQRFIKAFKEVQKET